MIRVRNAFNDDPEMRAARRPWCPARALARDRRRIAIHEAGHYVIARHLGLGHVFAVIWQGEPANPARNVWRDLCGQPRVGHHRRPVEDGMMLGCAGLVAELAWREMTKGGALRRVADYLREPNSMSCSDWSTCHAPPGDPAPALIRAAEHVAALLTPQGGPLWPELRGVARVLMRDGYIASSALAHMHYLCWQPPRVVFRHDDLEVLSDCSCRRVGSSAAPSLAEVSAAIDAMKAATTARQRVQLQQDEAPAHHAATPTPSCRANCHSVTCILNTSHSVQTDFRVRPACRPRGREILRKVRRQHPAGLDTLASRPVAG